MALEKPILGGHVLPTETFEAFADIPQNRVLLAEKLSVSAPTKPEIVENLTTVEAVFDHFKPSVQMDFETEEGTTRKETLAFSNVGDFGVKGITNQSDFLRELTMKKDEYQRIIRQLKANKLLKKALAEKENKENVISALKALITELRSTN